LKTPSASNSETIDALVENARHWLQNGQLQLAASLYAEILHRSPDHPDALSFFGSQALNSRQFSQSIELFQRALAVDPGDARLHKNLGLALRGRGALPEALLAFDRALSLKPDYPVALLHKAAILEQTEKHKEAIGCYLAALSSMDRLGLLAPGAKLPRGLLNLRKRAITAVQHARERHLMLALAPLRSKYGPQNFNRVDRCLRIYFGKEPLPAAHPKQHCTFMTFPDIPSHAWFERSKFPWLAEIESHTCEIRTELMGVLQDEQGFRPFVEMPRDRPGSERWDKLNYSPDWNAFFFYRDGQRFTDNTRRCPVTAGLLEKLPLNRIAEHSPETFFSVLKAGVQIPPHTGVINTRLVVHLPLIIPQECGLRVGDETRMWKEGECLVFDDTFEHEAWNHSDMTRVVLIFDIWNPYLTEIERQAMEVVVEESGRFNQLHGLSSQAYVKDANAMNTVQDTV
jgi:aspartate beta-hydroxylase